MRAREAALLRAKAGYVAAARRVGRRVTGRPVPPRERRWRHWARSLGAVYDVPEMVALDVPWWTYSAIDTVDRWLADRPRPIRVFEYGSGASTFWLARRADEVHAVEHHRGFADSIAAPLAAFGNVHLRVVEPAPSANPAVPSAKEGQRGLDFAAYVASVDDAGGRFDLVVIDGRAREACLARALPHLAPDGLIVFDNSRRARYRPAIATSGLSELRLRGLTPTLPYPEQTSLLTATPSWVRRRHRPR